MSIDQSSESEQFRGPRATDRQQAAARRRAANRGVSFGPLQSVGHGVREIEALEEIEVLLPEQRRAEDADIARAMEEEFGGATAFRDDEFEGYGSSASYASGVEDDDGYWD